MADLILTLANIRTRVRLELGDSAVVRWTETELANYISDGAIEAGYSWPFFQTPANATLTSNPTDLSALDYAFYRPTIPSPATIVDRILAVSYNGLPLFQTTIEEEQSNFPNYQTLQGTPLRYITYTRPGYEYFIRVFPAPTATKASLITFETYCLSGRGAGPEVMPGRFHHFLVDYACYRCLARDGDDADVPRLAYYLGRWQECLKAMAHLLESDGTDHTRVASIEWY